MTIPGRGDLSPLRHQASFGRWVVTVVVLLLLGFGGYFAFLALSGGKSSDSPAAKLPRCHNPQVAGPTSPRRVHLVVLNGTLQDGLAAQVRTALKRRGFHVPQIGNTPKLVGGIATITYGSGRLLAAQAVADQIKGAKLVKTGQSGITLELGQNFTSLQSKAKARAARARLAASEAATSPAPTPTPTSSPTCQAQHG